MEGLIHQLLSQPAVFGAALSAAMNWLHGFLTSVDTSGKAEKYASQLHIVFMVLSFLATVANAAASGHLASIDLTSVSSALTYFVQVVVGGKAISVAHGIVNPDKGKK